MSQLVISLIITVVGMGLVFVAIMVLWGLMEIIVQATAKAEKEEEAEIEGASTAHSLPLPEETGRQLKQKAAAAAVAIALALRRQAVSAVAETAPSHEMTAWQAASLAVRVNQRVSVMQRR